VEVVTMIKPLSEKDMIELETLINKIVFEEGNDIFKG
jgi:hypothetical protein